MRGFLVMSIAVIGLEVVLTSKLPGLSPLLAYPGQLAGKWMDPGTPLLPQRAGTTAAATSSAPAPVTLAAAVIPSTTIPAPSPGQTLN